MSDQQQQQQKITPFEAYHIHMALKLHFKSDSYDFFKYHGRTNATQKSFDARNDKYFFEKSANVFDREKYINKSLVEVLKNQSFFIKDIFSRENELEYMEWLGYMESFNQRFYKDLSIAKEYLILNNLQFIDLMTSENSHPILVKMMVKNQIKLETMVGMQRGYKLIDALDLMLENDPIWSQYSQKLKKYEPFIIKYLPEKKIIQGILLQTFKGLK